MIQQKFCCCFFLFRFILLILFSLLDSPFSRFCCCCLSRCGGCDRPPCPRCVRHPTERKSLRVWRRASPALRMQKMLEATKHIYLSGLAGTQTDLQLSTERLTPSQSRIQNPFELRDLLADTTVLYCSSAWILVRWGDFLWRRSPARFAIPSLLFTTRESYFVVWRKGKEIHGKWRLNSCKSQKKVNHLFGRYEEKVPLL